MRLMTGKDIEVKLLLFYGELKDFDNLRQGNTPTVVAGKNT